jgi:hypothetical protein
MSNEGYFKFHDATFTDSMLSGEWLVSSLDYYSYMELKSDDQWIGDHTESGIIHRNAGELSWESGHTPPEDEYMRKENLIGGAPLSGITFVDSTFFKPEQPAHIISLCHGDYDQCAYAMLKEPKPLYRYNACIEISDIKGFAQALWEEGRTSCGTPLSTLFEKPLVGPMVYADREGTISDQTPLRSGHFFKRSSYAKQMEFRIVLPHINEWCTRDRLVFNFPRPERFLKLRLSSTPSPKADDRKPEPDLLLQTVSFYERMCEAKEKDEAWVAVRDPELEAEMKRIHEGAHNASNPEAYFAENDAAFKWIQEAKIVESQNQYQYRYLFEEENTVALRDLLWRGRLEKFIRLRSNIAYLLKPRMHHLDTFHSYISGYYVEPWVAHMRG